MTKEEKEKLLELSGNGMPYKDIGKILNYTENYCMKVANANGIHHKKGRRVLSEVKERALNLYYSGLSIMEISKQLHIDRKTVYNYLRE